MNWENVREMLEAGMEFGTHTHTHAQSLSDMTLEVAVQELRECTETFKGKTGISPQVFCFPHGTTRDYDQRHVELIRSLNYAAGLTTNVGRNHAGQNPFELKRLIVYEEDSLWEVMKKLRGAYDFVGPLQKGWLLIAGANKYSDYQ